MPPAPAAAAQAKTGNPVDPFRNYNFLVQIQDMGEARFTECHGLAVRVQPIRYRESGAGQIVHALPGPLEYGDVLLKYGSTASQDLWTWMLSAAKGVVQRRHVSVVMLESDGVKEGMRWNLINAWPCEWSARALDALGREAAIEEMRLTFDSLERA